MAETWGMRELVTDAEDPRLADYARLTDMELRTSLESGQGLFIAEGTKVIGRAVAAGYPVRSMLVAERRLGALPALLPQLAATGAPVHVVPDETAERLTGYRVHRGALASLHRKPLPETAALAAAARRVIVLEDLVDHGNVGAIFRCAAALGVDAVFLSPRCADPLYRRAVKVSMGAVFAVPYARHDRLARRPGRAAGGRVPAAGADPGPVGHADRRGRDRPAGRAAARHRGRRLSSRWLREADRGGVHPDAPGAPWPPGSTRSTWSPPPPSPVTCWQARTRPVRSNDLDFHDGPACPAGPGLICYSTTFAEFRVLRVQSGWKPRGVARASAIRFEYAECDQVCLLRRRGRAHAGQVLGSRPGLGCGGGLHCGEGVRRGCGLEARTSGSSGFPSPRSPRTGCISTCGPLVRLRPRCQGWRSWGPVWSTAIPATR